MKVMKLKLFKIIKDWYLDACNLSLFELVLLTLMAMFTAIMVSKGNLLFSVISYLILFIILVSIVIQDKGAKCKQKK